MTTTVFALAAAAVGIPLLAAIAVESWRLHRPHRVLARDLTSTQDHSDEGDES